MQNFVVVQNDFIIEKGNVGAILAVAPIIENESSIFDIEDDFVVTY